MQLISNLTETTPIGLIIPLTLLGSVGVTLVIGTLDVTPHLVVGDVITADVTGVVELTND